MNKDMKLDTNNSELEMNESSPVTGAGACEDVIVAAELGAWGSLASFEVTGPFALVGWGAATLTSLGAAVASSVSK